MRRTLPISVLHGHVCGFVTLRGNIRCSAELTRRHLVHDLGEGLELAKVPGTERYIGCRIWCRSVLWGCANIFCNIFCFTQGDLRTDKYALEMTNCSQRVESVKCFSRRSCHTNKLPVVHLNQRRTPLLRRFLKAKLAPKTLSAPTPRAPRRVRAPLSVQDSRPLVSDSVTDLAHWRRVVAGGWKRKVPSTMRKAVRRSWSSARACRPPHCRGKVVVSLELNLSVLKKGWACENTV